MSKKLHIQDFSSDKIWDYENGFYWFSHPTRLAKLFAHYELYKSIIDLPGDIFELGVFKCASLIRFATIRQLLENDFSRKIVGFDVFGKFPPVAQNNQLLCDADLDFIDYFEKMLVLVCPTKRLSLSLQIRALEMLN